MFIKDAYEEYVNGTRSQKLTAFIRWRNELLVFWRQSLLSFECSQICLACCESR